MLEYVKRLIALRKKFVALRRGAMTNLYANGKAFAFARHIENETVIIAVNAGREPVTLDLRVDRLLADNTPLVEEWSREELIVQDGFVRGIEIGARDATILATII
jgi:glycosidase